MWWMELFGISRLRIEEGYRVESLMRNKQKNTGKQRLCNRNFGKTLDYNISKNISNLDLSQPIMITPVDPCSYFSTAVQGRLLPMPRLVLFSCLRPAAGPPSLPPLPCSVDDGCHFYNLPLLCLIMLESHFQ